MANRVVNWQQGIARNGSECEREWAWAWRDLIGLWVPALGPTGATLLDIGPRANHGTFSSLDPATDWIMSPWGYGLDFDGTDDVATLTATMPEITSLGTYTIAAFLQMNGTGSANGGAIIQNSNASNDRLGLSVRRNASGGVVFGYYNGSYVCASGAWPASPFVAVGTNYKGALSLYIDSVPQTGSTTTAWASSGARIGLGYTGYYINARMGLVGAWKRAFTSWEAALFSRDPLGMLVPKRRMRSGVEAGGGTARELAGVAAGSSSAQGALSATRAVAGGAVGAGAVQAALSRARAVVGAAVGAGAVGAALSTTRSIAGAAEGVGSVEAALSAERAVAGQAEGIGVVEGQLSRARSVSGEVTGEGIVGGEIGTLRSVSGEATGQGDVAGSIGRLRSVAGTVEGLGEVGAALATQRALAGTATGSAEVLGTLQALRAIAGGAIGAAAVSAYLGDVLVELDLPLGARGLQQRRLLAQELARRVMDGDELSVIRHLRGMGLR